MTTHKTQPKIIVGVDPGSITSGIAILRGDELLHWQVLKVPAKHHPIRRSTRMGVEIAKRIKDLVRPDEALVVVEVPGRYKGRARGGTLVTLGMVVMSVIWCIRSEGYQVSVVEVAQWCSMGGPKNLPKEDRARKVANKFPNYNPAEDRKFDASDAIGLAWWASAEESMEI